MSGSRGGSQQFGIRLSLEGQQQVEAGLRQVQDAAGRTSQAIEQAGNSAGRAVAVIERGTQAAGAALQKMGGDAQALVPILDSAGGAVGRLVTSLGSGAGLLGALGAVGGVVATAVMVYQNWDAVTRGVGAAYDFLTGRVRVTREQIAATNALLAEFNGLTQTAAARARDVAVADQQRLADRARPQVAQYDRQLAELDVQIERRRQEIAAGEERARLARAAGLPQVMDTGDPGAPLRALEEQRRRIQSSRDSAAGPLRFAQGNIAALGENAGTVINPELDGRYDPNLPLPPEWREPASGGGGGGGGGAPSRLDALRSRADSFAAANDALARYQQRLAEIGQLQADLQRAGLSPLPEEAVVRATEQAMQDYQRATEGAAQSTSNLADSSKDLERAGGAVAKTLSGAFEDWAFEGKKAADVVKDLERSLLRIGNRYLLEPLFQNALGGLFGGQGSGTAGGAGGGLAGIVGRLAGSLFGASGGAKGAIDAVGLVTAAAPLFHDGGLVGAGAGPSRMVPMGVFAGAPRYHAGGIIGPDEVPAILRRGEVVRTPQQEAALRGRMGGVTVNINGVTDAGSFRKSQAQIMGTFASALARVNRNR